MDGSCTKSCSNGRNSLSSAMLSPWRQHRRLQQSQLCRLECWCDRSTDEITLLYDSEITLLLDSLIPSKLVTILIIGSIRNVNRTNVECVDSSALPMKVILQRPRWTGQLNAVLNAISYRKNVSLFRSKKSIQKSPPHGSFGVLLMHWWAVVVPQSVTLLMLSSYTTTSTPRLPVYDPLLMARQLRPTLSRPPSYTRPSSILHSAVLHPTLGRPPFYTQPSSILHSAVLHSTLGRPLMLPQWRLLQSELMKWRLQSEHYQTSARPWSIADIHTQNSYWRSCTFSYWTGQPLTLNWVRSWSLQRGLHHSTFEKNWPGPIRCPIISTHFESISNIKTVGEDRSATARISSQLRWSPIGVSG